MLEYVPAATTLHSSEALGWEDVVVEHILLPRGEYQPPPLPEHRICLILNPTLTIEQERHGKTMVHTFRRGQAQLLPRGTTGYWRSSEDMQTLHVQMSQVFIERTAEQSMRFDPAQIEVRDHAFMHDAQIEHISLALMAELTDGGKNGRLYSSALASALAMHVLRSYTSNTGPALSAPKILSAATRRSVLDYIEAHLAEDLSLETLARLANVSASHFSALFRQSLGMAPHQYVLSRRVQRARLLLLHSDRSIIQIADGVGFYDQSHLTRHMRRVLGVTPAAVRRR